MKEIVLMVISIVLFGLTGRAQDNNTALALRRTLMVASVELLQRTTPVHTTKEDFNKQLIEMEVSAEGMLFLNKSFEFYKKEVTTEDILKSYEGKESHELVKFVKNGGRNVFGDVSEATVPGKKECPKWLRDILKVLLEITDIVINTCNALPWPC